MGRAVGDIVACGHGSDPRVVHRRAPVQGSCPTTQSRAPMQSVAGSIRQWCICGVRRRVTGSGSISNWLRVHMYTIHCKRVAGPRNRTIAFDGDAMSFAVFQRGVVHLPDAKVALVGSNRFCRDFHQRCQLRAYTHPDAISTRTYIKPRPFSHLPRRGRSIKWPWTHDSRPVPRSSRLRSP